MSDATDPQTGPPSQDERPADEADGARQVPAGQAIEVVTDDGDEPSSRITEPGKLMRIALMLRELREEVHRASVDDAGLRRLREINDRALEELTDVLSGDLREELADLTQTFGSDTPSESEIRIAQAQLIGWLEGLFQGIQAAIANQQMQARSQLEAMRRRGLPPGMRPPGADADEAGPGAGQYL